MLLTWSTYYKEFNLWPRDLRFQGVFVPLNVKWISRSYSLFCWPEKSFKQQGLVMAVIGILDMWFRRASSRWKWPQLSQKFWCTIHCTYQAWRRIRVKFVTGLLEMAFEAKDLETGKIALCRGIAYALILFFFTSTDLGVQASSPYLVYPWHARIIHIHYQKNGLSLNVYLQYP